MLGELLEMPAPDDSKPARGEMVFGEQFFVAPLGELASDIELPRNASTRNTNPEVVYTALPGNPKLHTNDGVTYGDNETYD